MAPIVIKSNRPFNCFVIVRTKTKTTIIKGETMFSKNLSAAVLLIISTACVANAYTTTNDPEPLPGYEEPFPGDNSSPCENPYEPCDPGNPGNPYDPANPEHPGDNDGGYDNGDQDHDVKRVYIGRSVRNERLRLRELAGLDSAYQGYVVVSVRGTTRPNSSERTVVQLIADGRVIASQTNPGYQIYLRPQIRAELGTIIRSLQLAVSGSTYIEDLEIEVIRSGSDGHNQQPGYGQRRVDIPIYRNTQTYESIYLSQYINLSQYRGLTVKQVIVTGSSLNQNAYVDLLISNYNYGQVVFAPYRQQQSFWVQNQAVIGQNTNDIRLDVRGNMNVEKVTLVLSR